MIPISAPIAPFVNAYNPLLHFPEKQKKARWHSRKTSGNCQRAFKMEIGKKGHCVSLRVNAAANIGAFCNELLH
jgi:hypothetical protein